MSIECEAIRRSVSVALCCSSEFIKKGSEAFYVGNNSDISVRAPNLLDAATGRKGSGARWSEGVSEVNHFRCAGFFDIILAELFKMSLKERNANEL